VSSAHPSARSFTLLITISHDYTVRSPLTYSPALM
jgi:hypothetical protein